MNVADLVHSAVTGRWKIDRLHAREVIKRMKLYAGARPGNRRESPNQLSTPEDFKQAQERIVLIRAARQMEEDMGFFDGLLGDFETYVVGELRYMSNTGNPEADAAINEYLEWQFDICDYAQKLDLPKIARLAIRSMKRDGEMGLIFRERGGEIKLQQISGDRIGNPTTGTNASPTDYNGIVVDPNTEAPTAYRIYRRLPKMNAYTFQEEIRPENFRHYYEPFRIEQQHGVTVFKNAIEHAFDMKQIIDFTKLNIKYRSSQLPYVTNEQGRPRGSGYEDPPPDPVTGEPRPLSIMVAGVEQSFLKLGEGVMEYPNDFPNQQFATSMEELRRECCAGAKLPMEFVYRSQTGGVVQRFFVDKAQRTFDEDKRWLRRTLLNPGKNRMIQNGIDSGQLNLDRFGDLSSSLKRFAGTWQMGRAISVDYGREVQADIALMDRGAMSLQDYVAENGGDLRIIRAQNKNQVTALMEDAKEVSEKTGQPIEQVLPYLCKLFPNPAPVQSNDQPVEVA